MRKRATKAAAQTVPGDKVSGSVSCCFPRREAGNPFQLGGNKDPRFCESRFHTPCTLWLGTMISAGAQFNNSHGFPKEKLGRGAFCEGMSDLQTRMLGVLADRGLISSKIVQPLNREYAAEWEGNINPLDFSKGFLLRDSCGCANFANPRNSLNIHECVPGREEIMGRFRTLSAPVSPKQHGIN